MDVDQIIREIAAKHGIAVGRDDPVLILMTINAHLMQESAAAQRQLIGEFKSAIEDVSRQWGDDTKKQAENILNAALAASRKTLLTGLDEVTAQASSEREHAWQAMSENVTTFKRLTKITLSVTIACNCVMLLIWYIMFFSR